MTSLAALVIVGGMVIGADLPEPPAQPAPTQGVAPPAARPAGPVAAGPGPKMVIERPTKVVLRAKSAPVAVAPVPRPALDRPKSVAIERPTTRVVRDLSSPAAAVPVAGFVNPKVEPGKVRWHPSFAAACAASARSGKPVLLFQMMGKLDDQFC